MPLVFTVAIDGPAAAGKGTVARRVAEATGFAHLDTGLLYRAVGLRAADGQDPVEAARGFDFDGLADPRLRGAEAADLASRVAVIPEVRAALRGLQRAFARREGGAVMDGRDVGTVICPEAEAKLFVTASAGARAERRWRELLEAGREASLEGTLADVLARDARDEGRSDSPLRRAQDAVLIDTSALSVEEAVAAALRVVRDRLAGG